MKKKLLAMFLTLGVVATCIAIVKTNVSANDDDLGVRRNKDTEIVEDVDISEFDTMMPVFTALGAQIHNEDVEYHPYKGNFYEVSLSYLLAYMKDSPLVKYTEDDDNYYLDDENVDDLTNYAFSAGAYEAIYDYGKDAEAYYDMKSHLFVVRKRNIPMDYSIKIYRATCSHGQAGGLDYCYYDLDAELYKGDEFVGNMRYQLECDDGYYSVVSAEIEK